MKEKVALICKNGNGFVEALLDIWEAENIAVLIDILSSVKSIEKIILEEKITEAYVDSQNEVIILALKNLNIKIIKINVEDIMYEELQESSYLKFHSRYADDVAIVFFSSGTTDNAKGIVLSHNAINTNADKIQNYIQGDSDKIIGVVKSLVHSSTLVGELLVALKSKMKLFFIKSMSPALVLKSIQKLNINIICLNPTLLQILSKLQKKKKYIFPLLQEIYVSGDIISDFLIFNAESIFGTKVYNVYGVTECGPRIAAQQKGMRNLIGSVGYPLKGVEIYISKYNKKEYGDIWVKTECFMNGYLDKNIIISKSNGFWNTGDYGYIESGQLFVLGRSKNIIVSAGRNVNPEIIENMICQTNLVKEIVIIGIPDKIFGEKVICIYSDEKEKNKQLKDFFQQNLSPHERPQKIIRVKNSIRRNGNRKIDRNYYRKKFEKDGY